MTKILKEHKTRIHNAMVRMICSVPAHAPMPLDTFLNLFFTAKQREHMDTVAAFVDMGKYHPGHITLKKLEVNVPEDIPLAEGTSRDFSVTLSVRTSYKGFCPQSWEFHPNVSHEYVDEFYRCAEAVTLQGSIRAMWERIQQYYIEEAGSHEEMRYLFPGTVGILRDAGLDAIASTVESVKRRPSVHLPKDMADIFRYMNQWYATQIVLGTFERGQPQRSDDTVDLYLQSTYYRDGHVVLKS